MHRRNECSTISRPFNADVPSLCVVLRLIYLTSTVVASPCSDLLIGVGSYLMNVVM